MNFVIDFAAVLKDAKRVAIIGVGSESVDDAAGVELVSHLGKKLKSENVLLINAGTVPENFTSKVKKFKPSHVIFIDAAHFGGEPGDVVLADKATIVGMAISTHKLPLSVLAEYIERETGAKVLLLGIQPSQTLAMKMNPGVREAVERLESELLGVLNGF